MRFGKVMLCFLSVIFLTVIVCFGVQMQRQKEQMPFSVVIQADGRKENVKCWQNEAGEYYIFLPSYADLTHTTISFDRNAVVSIDNQLIENGVTCEFLQLDTPYALKYVNKSRNLDTTLTFLQSGNVPTIYIDVQSGNMDYIHAVKGNEESGKMRLYSADGGLEYAGSIKSINGRGNSTWTLSKKPYSLSLVQEANFLGMGAAQNWILLANAYDTSNLRNKIVYDFAQAVGLDYSPQCQWVDLYLNGDYAGLYLLCTRNEIHEQRVAISKKNSFLVSMELQWRLENQDIPFVKTDRSSWLAFRIHDSTVETGTLQAILQSMENAILAEDGIDPVTEKYYLELIDLDSWAKRYLIDEVFSNYDGGSLSQFFYFDGGDESEKIYAGPVWDMDNSLSIGGYPANAIWAGRPHLWESTDEPLFYALLQKDEFYQRVLQLYAQVFRPEIENLLSLDLDEYTTQILQAAYINAIRWDAGDISEDKEYIRTYIEERTNFLNDCYFGDTEYAIVQMANPEGWVWFCYAVPCGEPLSENVNIVDYTVEFGEANFLGYYDVDTDEIYDITQPIFSDVTIYPKWEFPDNESEEDSQMSNDQDSISKWEIIPSVVLLGLLAAMFIADFANSKRNGGQKNERRISRSVSP